MEKFDKDDVKKYVGKTCLFKVANLKQDYYTIYVGDVRNGIMRYKDLPTDENWQYCDVDKFVGHIFIVSPFDVKNAGSGKRGRYTNGRKRELHADLRLKTVRRLREATGAGMTVCRKALEACGYDRFDEARQWLKENGYEIAVK